MTFYDRTKEDSRPYREYQDTAGQALDNAKKAKAAIVEAETAKGGTATAISIKPTHPSEEGSPYEFYIYSPGGETEQLIATILANVPGATIEYTSSAPSIATVSNSGLITATGTSQGFVTITAKLTRTTKGLTTVLGTASTTGYASAE